MLVWSFGDNSECQTGHPRIMYQKKPTVIKLNQNIKSISAGESHSICLNSEGQAYGFGCTESGQLGLGLDSPIALPTLIPIEDQIIEIQSGKSHTLFRTVNGEVYSTGSGSSAQLGYIGEIQSTPRKISSLKGVNIQKIICGWFHNLAISDQGEIFSWGLGIYGQLSIGVESNMIHPTIIKDLGDVKIKLASAGLYHTIVVTEDNRVFSFGYNKHGQLGVSTSSKMTWKPEEIPIDFLDQDESIEHIQSGMYHNILATSSGKVFAWGYNELGQLGVGDREMKQTPHMVLNLWGKRIKALNCGAYHSIAVDFENNIWVWGQGTEYQLGNEQIDVLDNPQMLTPNAFGDNEIISVETGWAHTLVLTTPHQDTGLIDV